MLKLNDSPTQFRGLHRLPIGLLAIRLVLAIYLLQWGILQLVYPEAALDVYLRWFGLSPANTIVTGVGGVLTLSALMMAAGLGRRVSYAVGVLFMGAMVAGLTPHLLDPYGFHQPPNWINHGLIAQVPAFAGYVLLYVLRAHDTYSLESKLQARKDSGEPGPHALPGDTTAARALLLIRITCGLFFFQWGVEKFLEPEMSASILERWYSVGVYQEVVTLLVGVFEILLALAIMTGTLRRLTYGIAALVKAKTCWAIAALLLFPFATESGGRLTTVAASVPVLGVLWFLYWARAWDTLSLDARREPKTL